MSDIADDSDREVEAIVERGLARLRMQSKAEKVCEECGGEPMKLKHGTTARFCQPCWDDLQLIANLDKQKAIS